MILFFPMDTRTAPPDQSYVIMSSIIFFFIVSVVNCVFRSPSIVIGNEDDEEVVDLRHESIRFLS